MKRYLTLFFVCLILSCDNTVQEDGQICRQLPGDWVTVEPKASSGYPKVPPQTFKYTFYSNGMGVVGPEKDTVQTNLMVIPFGLLEINWKVQNSILSLYNPDGSVRNTAKIVDLEGDTLNLLFDEKLRQTWVRKHYTLDQSITFDRILLSTTGCFGSCPETYMMVCENGNFYYWGGMYAKTQGAYMARMPEGLYKLLANNFRKANLSSLKNNYAANHTDDRSVITSFAHNNSIVKTIDDYGAAAPTDFVRAYLFMEHRSRYLPNRKMAAPLLDYFPYARVVSVNGKKKASLLPNECFLLWVSLIEGHPTQQHFPSKYTIFMSPELFPPLQSNKGLNWLQTDGRYYEIHRKAIPHINIDIGFNFFEKNPGLLMD